uniref:Immunoglobulin V-set domain-containing protein n=1 Tax=Oryzias latipes TaxID=8090 RepID=A0A3P9JZJ2_ORYLA
DQITMLFAALLSLTLWFKVSFIFVRQDPSDIIIKASSSIQIFCSHDKTDFYLMLWYQQTPGHTDMKLIGYLHYSATTMEQKYKDDFKISGDLSGSTAKNGSLMIKKAEQNSSAVYFCAASKAQ